MSNALLTEALERQTSVWITELDNMLLQIRLPKGASDEQAVAEFVGYYAKRNAVIDPKYVRVIGWRAGISGRSDIYDRALVEVLQF